MQPKQLQPGFDAGLPWQGVGLNPKSTSMHYRPPWTQCNVPSITPHIFGSIWIPFVIFDFLSISFDLL